MAPHSSTLAWRIPGMGKPGGLPSMGSHTVGHDWSDLAAAAAHRKGPIDLEKYKLDQGTIRKWTDPTVPTTPPEKVLVISLLFLWSFFFCLFFLFLLFFQHFKIFKSSTTPLIFIFITYYYFSKKDPIFKANFIYIFLIIFVTLFFFFFSLILYFWKSNLYSRFLIFAFWYLLSILYL